MQSIENVVSFLEQYKLLLTTAESCTAGLIASLLADVPGCGAVLEGGYIVYSAQAKQNCLNVNPETIKTYGLTSEEVAREMALGALICSRANITVAVTGTAESDDHLNGVICFAYAMRIDEQPQVISETLRFEGERNEVRKAAALHAILALPYFHTRLTNQADNDA